jgi:hypothetical protein
MIFNKFQYFFSINFVFQLISFLDKYIFIAFFYKMSQSTPINQIRRNEQSSGNNQSNDNQLIDDILREMGESPGLDNQGDINVNSLQYTMDSSQVPPERLAHSKFDEMSKNMNQEMENQLADPLQTNISNSSNIPEKTDNLLNNINLKLNGSFDLKSRIINFIKIPVVVFITTLIFGLPQVNRFIFKFLPRLLHESGQITMGGILLKSFIMTIIVVIAQYFL